MYNKDVNIIYGENSTDDMIVDHEYHVNTSELSEILDDEHLEAYIDNLNDWD